jgi:hypothetical protein
MISRPNYSIQIDPMQHMLISMHSNGEKPGPSPHEAHTPTHPKAQAQAHIRNRYTIQVSLSPSLFHPTIQQSPLPIYLNIIPAQHASNQAHLKNER